MSTLSPCAYSQRFLPTVYLHGTEETHSQRLYPPSQFPGAQTVGAPPVDLRNLVHCKELLKGSILIKIAKSVFLTIFQTVVDHLGPFS